MSAASEKPTPYPLLFRPLLKQRVWGGEALRELGKPVSPGNRIGESWEVADLPESITDGRSVVAHGAFANQTLHQVISSHDKLVMGDGRLTEQGGFPLLIKYLDARENLSVQVHPTAGYVAKHPEAHLKSEAWVVVKSKAGSLIYTGLRREVLAEDLQRHIETGEVENDLVAVPARQGDCFYLPSGTCHALGAGVVVAEIQTPSDTTFRAYDWGRTGRELHVQQALECITFGAQAVEPAQPNGPIEAGGLRTTRLLATEYFDIERVDAVHDDRFEFALSGLPEVWMMIQGTGAIVRPGSADVDLAPGVTTLLPAALEGGRARLKQGAWLLRVKLPSQLGGIIART